MDDGWGGVIFNRLSFQDVIGDAEGGRIGTIIVKDMSRFGRDYLNVGFYTKMRFPEMGVRFITEPKKLPEVVSGFDNALRGSLVEHVTVGKDKTMVFTLPLGLR